MHNESSYHNFINDLKQYPQITAEETNSFVAIYKKEKKEEDINKIILGNMKFIISRANRFKSNTLSSTDLIYAGMCGIKRAAIKFDPSKNIKFMTYAAYWIDMFMRREIIRNASIVRITPRTWEMSSKISKMKNKGCTEHQILSHINIKKKTFSRMRHVQPDVSLNSIISEDSSEQELGKIWLIDYNSPAEQCISNESKIILSTLINKLHSREKDILVKRFGLNGNKEQTLKQLSKIHNITSERVRQLISKSLKKLKKTLNDKNIKNRKRDL